MRGAARPLTQQVRVRVGVRVRSGLGPTLTLTLTLTLTQQVRCVGAECLITLRLPLSGEYVLSVR